jgi:PAS domain S-box-containing protein
MFRKVQNIIIGLVALYVLISMGSFVAYQYGQFAGLRRLLRERAESEGVTLDRLLKLKGASLEALAYDYTYWDEMVSFIATSDTLWAHEMIAQALPTYEADVAWVFGPDWSRVYSVTTPTNESLANVNLAGCPQLFNDGHFCHFFARTGSGLLEIQGASVHPSNDLARRTPAQGYFLVGRRWSDQYCANLAQLTEGTISLEPVTTQKHKERPLALPTAPNRFRSDERQSRVTVIHPLAGWDGKPVAQLSYQVIATDIQALRRSTIRGMRWFAGFALILIGLLLYSVMRWVTRPLGLVSRSLAAEDATPIRALAKDRTEFGRIAQLIRDFLNQKQALRESEELYRELFESTSDLVQSVGPDGRIVYVNRAWRETLGYSPEDLPRLTLMDVVHPDCRAHCREIFQQVVSGQNVEHIEAVFVAKDGRQISVEGSANCKFENGRPVHTRGIFHDITARKRVEAELALKNVELKDLNEQKNRLLGMAAHDLRNPLSIIVSYSDFMLGGSAGQLTPEHQKFLSAIKRNSDFMVTLINDLLDVSKIEAGRLDFDRQMTDLVGLIRGVADLSRALAEKKNIRLTVDCPPELPPLLLDVAKIEQVLENLISNAIKFSNPETAISVSLARRDGNVVLAVQDHGQGIPAEELSKLFQPFGRTSVRGTAGEKSTGLGLAIVKRIVEGHGGTISVASEAGKGSTFTVTLPVGVNPA